MDLYFLFDESTFRQYFSDADYQLDQMANDLSDNTARIVEFKQPEDPKPSRNNNWSLDRTLALYSRWLINAVILGTGDLLSLLASIYAGGMLRMQLQGESMMIPDWSLQSFMIAFWLFSASFLKLLPGWGLGAVEELRRTIVLLGLTFSVTAFAMFLGKTTEDYSRLTLTLALLFSVFLLPLVRTQLKRLLIRSMLWGMRSMVYGDYKTAGLMVKSLEKEVGLGYYPVGIYDPFTAHPPKDVDGVPVYKSLDDKSVFATAAIMAMPQLSREELLERLDAPLNTYRHVVIIPDLEDAPSLWVQPRDMGGILGLEISCNLLDPWSRALKRVTDLLFIVALLPLFLLAMGAVAFAIFVTEGKSPFFVQERIGRSGRPFRMWKFRTMRADAEEYLEKELDQDDKLREEWETHFKLKNDPRITRIGQFLRITSLDELPQIINVLRGEMSIVGPRPLPDYHYDPLPGSVKVLRERVRPGMSGLWQVSGRSETGTRGIEKWDSYYVRNWSIWLDIVIIIRTLRVVLTGKGAY